MILIALAHRGDRAEVPETTPTRREDVLPADGDALPRSAAREDPPVVIRSADLHEPRSGCTGIPEGAVHERIGGGEKLRRAIRSCDKGECAHKPRKGVSREMFNVVVRSDGLAGREQVELPYPGTLDPWLCSGLTQ